MPYWIVTVLKFAISPRGLMIVAALSLLAWHQADKLIAAKRAVASFIAKEELAIVQAEKQELQRRIRISEQASQSLKSRRALDLKTNRALELELENYAKTETFNPACVVDDAFVGRLLNN